MSKLTIKTEKEFWKSKKWWAMITGVAVPVLNKIFDLNLNPEELQLIVASLVAYVMGQGVADIGKYKEEKEYDSQ